MIKIWIYHLKLQNNQTQKVKYKKYEVVKKCLEDDYMTNTRSSIKNT